MSVEQSELVSVIVPVYNAAKYLGRALQSVICQSHRNIEILIVLDGPTDDSVEVAKSYHDSRIRIFEREHQGAAAARNFGIKNAKGENVAFLDADDFWDSSKLEKHLKHFKRNPSIGVSFSCSAFVNEAGESFGLYQTPKLKNIANGYQCYCNPIGNGSTAVVRKSILDEFVKSKSSEENRHQYFRENLPQAHDYLFWLELSEATNCKFEGIPEILTYYRIHSESLSANIKKQYRYHLRAERYFSTINAKLINLVESKRRAHLHYYLARTALLQNNYTLAVGYASRGLKRYPSSFGLVPASIISLGCLSRILPKTLFKNLKSLCFLIFGCYQRSIILRLAGII